MLTGIFSICNFGGCQCVFLQEYLSLLSAHNYIISLNNEWQGSKPSPNQGKVDLIDFQETSVTHCSCTLRQNLILALIITYCLGLVIKMEQI